MDGCQNINKRQNKVHTVFMQKQKKTNKNIYKKLLILARFAQSLTLVGKKPFFSTLFIHDNC